MRKNCKNLKINFAFLALAVILAAAFFMLSLERFRAYRSEVSVIFIAKNEPTVSQLPYILKNARKLIPMLSFYEKMIASNENIQDSFAGLEKDERKKLWNKNLKVKAEDGSSILTISITNKNKEQSALLAKGASHTLLGTLSYYYNIKEELDMRIAEGPITSAAFPNWWIFLALSALAGIALAGIADFIGKKAADIFFLAKAKKFEEPVKEKVREEIYPKEMPAEPAAEKISEDFAKRAKAPENLPTGPVEERLYEKTGEETREQIGYGEISSDIPEPTQEEYKRRLNELLKG
jgi:capsular polysaccharide biosynthesis protein